MDDETTKGWHSRGYVAHFDALHEIQHITFHLADSLPEDAINQIKAQIHGLPEEKQDLRRRMLINDYLDAGYGSCILRRPDVARIVEQAFFFSDGERYRLLEWVVMPNHVHVLIQQLASLGKIVHSWKISTTKRIRALDIELASERMWHLDYWDRFIRNQQHYFTAMDYIHDNPVKAGLVRRAADWPFGSARFGRERRDPWS